MTATPVHGFAHAVTSKDEDAHAVLSSECAMLFGIFDGHGGKRAAHHCRDSMSPSLLVLAPDMSEKAVADTFWAADAAMGQEIVDGTTATVLLVSKVSSSLACLLAWVGDSTAVSVDMLCQSHKDAVTYVTPDHKVTSIAEVARLNQEWAVRNHLHAQRVPPPDGSPPKLKEASEGKSSRRWSYTFTSGATSAPRSREMTSPHSATSPSSAIKFVTFEEARDATVALGMQLDEAEMRMLHRALGREQTIALAEKRVGSMRRASTLVGARFANGVGPLTLIAPREGSRAQGRAPPAVSTCITRSIGDWDGSRALVPQPEHHRFDVHADEFTRVVIASDGLWDFLKPAEAAKQVRLAPTAQQAADQLVKLVKRRSINALGVLKDDTTVLVIDLNPAARTSWPALEERRCAVGCGCLGGGDGRDVTELAVASVPHSNVRPAQTPSDPSVKCLVERT